MIASWEIEEPGMVTWRCETHDGLHRCGLCQEPIGVGAQYLVLTPAPKALPESWHVKGRQTRQIQLVRCARCAGVPPEQEAP